MYGIDCQSYKHESKVGEGEQQCCFSVKLIEVEALTIKPINGIDESWSKLEGRAIQRVPILRIFGSTPSGQKCAVNVHNVFPYFFVNVPEHVITSHDSLEKLTFYASQLALSLNRAVMLHLGQQREEKIKNPSTVPSRHHDQKTYTLSKEYLNELETLQDVDPDGYHTSGKNDQFVHMISIVQGKSFYGYTPHSDLFFKIFIYNPLLITRMSNLLRSKSVMQTSFRVYESHIPYSLQFFIDYKIYGMEYINFSHCTFRAPVPVTKRDLSWPDIESSVVYDEGSSQIRYSQGALCFKYHLLSNIPRECYNLAQRETRSELELDVDASWIIDIRRLQQNQQQNASSLAPNLSQSITQQLQQQMVPSLSYMWDDERLRRYESAMAEYRKNPDANPLPSLSQSLDLGSMFDSETERLVDSPVAFHKSIVDKFRKLVKEDEKHFDILKKNNSSFDPLIQDKYASLFSHFQDNLSKEGTMEQPSASQAAMVSSTPAATTNYGELLKHESHLKQQQLQNQLRETQEGSDMIQVDEDIVASQSSDGSLVDVLEWMKEDLIPFDDNDLADFNMNDLHISQIPPTEEVSHRKSDVDDIFDIMETQREQELEELEDEEESAAQAEKNSTSRFVDHESFLPNSVQLSPRLEFSKRQSPTSLHQLEDIMESEEQTRNEQTEFKSSRKKAKYSVSFIETTNVYHFYSGGIRADSIEQRPLAGEAGSLEDMVTPPCSKPVQFVEDSIIQFGIPDPQSSNVGYVGDSPLNENPQFNNDKSARVAKKEGVKQSPFSTKTLHLKVLRNALNKKSTFSGHKDELTSTQSDIELTNQTRASERISPSLSSTQDVMGTNRLTISDLTEMAESMESTLSSMKKPPGGFQERLDLEKMDVDVFASPFSRYSPTLPIQSSVVNYSSSGTPISQRLNDGFGKKVIKYSLSPPSWNQIVDGMRRDKKPMLKYLTPYYSIEKDIPYKQYTFAGTPMKLEHCDFDTLPSFDSLHSSSTAHCPSFYQLGAQEQSLKWKGRRGMLRALTPARKPPIVLSPQLYTTSSSSVEPSSTSIHNTSVKSSKQSISEITSSKALEIATSEEDDFDIVPASPKLSERRPVQLRKHLKANPHQILEEQHREDRKRKLVGDAIFGQFSSSQLNQFSQIEKPKPTNDHGFNLPPEVRKSLGGTGLEGLTMMSVEVLALSNGKLNPDPRFCPVEAIFYCIRDDFVIRKHGASNYKDHIVMMCLKRSRDKAQGGQSEDVGDELLGGQKVDLGFERREFDTEIALINAFRDAVVSFDPDIVMGYECQQSSIGYLFERTIHLKMKDYISSMGRSGGNLGNTFTREGDSWGYRHQSGISMSGRIVFNVWRIMRAELDLQSYSFESMAFHVLHRRVPHYSHSTISDWYTGLDSTSFDAVSITTSNQNPTNPNTPSTKHPPQHNQKQVQLKHIDPAKVYHTGSSEQSNGSEATFPTNFISTGEWKKSINLWRVEKYFSERCQGNFFLLDALNIVSRVCEFAKMYGITFYSVLSRGSQFRVESLMMRMTKPMNYVCFSPTRQQVAQQLAPESIPLVMEPQSTFYTDPVLVLDFQSLYPSVIIAYNYCFSTCLGKIQSGESWQPLLSASNKNSTTPMSSDLTHSSHKESYTTQANVAPLAKTKRLGVTHYEITTGLISQLQNDIYCAPNGVMYLKAEKQTGIIPRMLHEILETRVMVKSSMKKLKKQPLLWSLLESRQLGLKMIANVTYGYASASFSGRMPCVDIADSIVQTGRETLERAIKLVNSNSKWGAQVVYGDTDSLFIMVKGASKERAFEIGREIADAVTELNPWPVKLRFEKCYHPCVLLAKKRYCGYMYESPDQTEPIFEAKGIETVRRDTCPAVAAILEKCLRTLFETKDLSLIKSYLTRQWAKILQGKVSIQDFIFRKEVRLGTYKNPDHAPPAALVAIKELQHDPRAAPRYGERVPYLVVHGHPKSRLMDLVHHPRYFSDHIDSTHINATYYITKNIIPVLTRVFGLFGVSVADWYAEMPKKLRSSKRPIHMTLFQNHHQKQQIFRRKETIDQYFSSMFCPICNQLTSQPICENCSSDDNKAVTTYIHMNRTKRMQNKQMRIHEICMQCMGPDSMSSGNIDCDSLDCNVYYERNKYDYITQAMESYIPLLRSWGSEDMSW